MATNTTCREENYFHPYCVASWPPTNPRTNARITRITVMAEISFGFIEETTGYESEEGGLRIQLGMYGC